MVNRPPVVDTIDAGSHPVVVGADSLVALERMLRDADPTTCFVLGDENTLRQCLPELLAHVPSLREAATIGIAPGERSKSLEVCGDIWRYLTERTADREAILVTLGGGVVSDLGGFVAGSFKRGMRCIHVPTSLMAMVDAAIGGKTGIDHAGVKNNVGLYHDPLGVFIHAPFLRTLGKRELLNGVAEMVKHGLVRDAAHWTAVTNAQLHDLDALGRLVAESARVKAAVVKEDPRERGPRKLLNFGHTIGHGIEAFSWEGEQRALLHGEAVAIGMICETWLSWRAGSLDRDANDAITKFLLELYKPFRLHGSAAHRIIELMRNDKKNVAGQFRFTLLTGIGQARTDVPVSAAQVQEALDHYRLLVEG